MYHFPPDQLNLKIYKTAVNCINNWRKLVMDGGGGEVIAEIQLCCRHNNRIVR